MQWARMYDTIVDASIERGEYTHSMKTKPDLIPELNLVWEAFSSLSLSRGHSLRFGKKETQYIVPDAIAFSEISRYSDAVGIDTMEQKFRFIRLIQAMDSAYIGKITEKVK